VQVFPAGTDAEIAMMYRRTAFSLALCLALGAGASAQESQRDHGAPLFYFL